MSRNDEKYMKSGSNIRHTSEDLFGHELDGSTSGQASTGLGHASGRAWIHSGIYNFDHFLGGGFPVGSLNIIEQDEFGVYANVLLKCLITNQLYNQNRVDLLIGSSSISAAEYIEGLPKKKEIPLSKLHSNNMKIAWRYNSLPNLQTLSVHKCHFDLGSRMDKIESSNHNMIDNFFIVSTSKFEDIVNHIKSTLHCKKVRILIVENLHCAMNRDSGVCPKLFKLKSLTRNHPNLTIFVPMNAAFWSKTTRNQIANIADGVLQVQALNEENNIYNDFSAIIKINKMPKLNSITFGTNAETLDIGIEMLKNDHYVLVQQLSLPPDESETASRSTSSSSSSPSSSQPSSSSSCSTAKVDF